MRPRPLKHAARVPNKANPSHSRPGQVDSATFSSAAFRKYDPAATRFPFAGFTVAVFCSIALAEYGPFANSSGLRYTAALYASQKTGPAKAIKINLVNRIGDGRALPGTSSAITL